MKELNRKRIRKIYLFSLIIFLVLMVSIGIIIYLGITGAEYHPPETLYSEYGDVYINPQTIISEISEGNIKFDQAIENNSGLNIPENDSGLEKFSEEEFMKISNSFFEIYWQDNIDDWRLMEIAYDFYDCNKGMNGIVYASYVYEKYIEEEKQSYTIIRHVSITPWKNTIGWREKVEIRSISATGIEWSEVNVNATDAFNISKNNYEEFLSEHEYSSCREVNMFLFDKASNDWYIDYRSSEDYLVSLTVNTKTGKVRIK